MTEPHRQPRRSGIFAKDPTSRLAAVPARAARGARAARAVCSASVALAMPAAHAAWVGRFARAAGATCIACAFLAACGRGGGGAPAAGGSSTGGTAGTAGGSLPDACELLAPADVEAVTREASGSLSSTLEDAVGKDPTQCSYSLGGDMPPRMISLSLRRAPGAEEAASRQRAAESGLRSIAAGAPVEELPRLGDGAFWIGGRIDQLNVRRGDTLLVFTVQLDRDPLGAARALAGKALARLAHPASFLRPAPPGGAPAAPGASPQSGGPP